MPTLYEINEDLRAVANELYESGGEITDELDRWLEQLIDDRDAKFDDYCCLIREFEARAETRKAEADRIAALAKVDANNAQRLKDRLKWLFEQRGYKRIDTKRFRITLAGHGGKLPVMLDESVPASALPPQFQRARIDFNKDAIREALEKGETLTFAALGERGSSIRIK